MKRRRVVIKRIDISSETKENIINYFKNNKDNRTSKIASIFGVLPSQASYIINCYLEQLIIKTDNK